MRLVMRIVLEQAFRAFWRRRLADQYAVLIADVGLTCAEQEAFLALRRSR